MPHTSFNQGSGTDTTSETPAPETTTPTQTTTPSSGRGSGRKTKLLPQEERPLQMVQKSTNIPSTGSWFI